MVCPGYAAFAQQKQQIEKIHQIIKNGLNTGKVNSKMLLL